MATICPLCKTTKLNFFNTYSTLDGTFCKDCYNKAHKKGISQPESAKLTTSEMAYYINEIPAEDTSRWLNLIFAQRRRVQRDEVKTLPVLADFQAACSEFFETPGVKENSSLQSCATQTFWHVCRLKKMRLDKKSIQMQSKVVHRALKDLSDYLEEKRYDGRYESKVAQETVTGSLDYVRDKKKICGTVHFNLAKYRVMSAYYADNNLIVCPSCGNPASRENLLDGCDYCGTVFSVEDFTDKISDYSFYENKGVEASANIEDIKKMSLFSVITKTWQSVDQEAAAYEQEERRHSDGIVKRIRKCDPGFSAEELYSQIGNMLTAHYFADDPRQVAAFWEDPNEEFLKSFVDAGRDVIDARINSIQLTDFATDDAFQTVWAQAEVEIQRDPKSVSKAKENKIHTLRLVRAAGCKSQAVCETKLYRCKGCGASLSLMNGCRCEFCGEGLRLSDYSWAFAGIDEPHEVKQNEVSAGSVQTPMEFKGKYCDVCGRKIGENEAFCSYCGTISTYKYVEEASPEEQKIPLTRDQVYFSKKYDMAEDEKILLEEPKVSRTTLCGSLWLFQLTTKALVFTFVEVLIANRDEGFTTSPDVIPLTDILTENGEPLIKQKGDHVIVTTPRGDMYIYFDFAKDAKKCMSLMKDAYAAAVKGN